MSSPPENSPPQATYDFLSGTGEMVERIRAFDWSRSPLGPIEQWPQSLRTALSICLNSKFPMVIWWGAELTLLYNDGWRPILGATKHPRALGSPGRDIWPEIWDVIGPMFESVMREGAATWSDDGLLLVNRHGYKEEAYFTWSYSPIRDESGGVGGVFTAVTETTQRVVGERRLQTLRDLSARTVEEAKTAEEACRIAAATLAQNPRDIPFALLYLIDADGRRARLVGTAGVGDGVPAIAAEVDLTSEGEGASAPWPLARVAATGRREEAGGLTGRFVRVPQGVWPDPPHTALLLPIVKAGQEQPAGVLVAGLSPYRALGEDYLSFLELAAGHIATVVASARAYNEERRRAEALAELDRAKTLFFSNVSHEFRTPLTLLLGPLEEALAKSDGALPPAEREQLELAHRNGLRLLKLVNTLLDFSRIEAGRTQAVYEPVDLAAYTAELSSAFRSAVERAGLRFFVYCPPLSEPVYVDREMWEKVVLNLLSNAFKFTLEGEIQVLLEEKEGRVELRVRDTGTGIPAEEIPHVFERFHRVKGARGRTHEGTGIGLALVRELVKLHGGAVTAESVYGRGTTFTVSLPKGTAHLPQVRVEGARTLASTALGATPFVEEALRWLPASADGAGTTADDFIMDKPAADGHPPGHPTDGARVLLADDNADMRDYVRRLLAGRYEVEAVADGQAALDAVRERVPDLVLTDVMMPRLDGFGLLRGLRADALTRTVPVIMLSARAGEESRVEGLEAGADDYLVKPFGARELLARVRANLEMARLRREFTAGLEAAHARNEQILASISDAFFAFDREWRYVYVNEHGVEVARRPRSELLGRSVWEVFPDTVGTEMETQWRRAVKEQAPVAFEYHYAPYGRWFEHHVYPSPEGVTVIIADITGRKRVEAAIREGARQLALVTDTAPVYIAHCDTEARFKFVNRPYAERFGLKPQVCVGKHISEVVGAEAYETFRRHVEKALSGRPVEFETEVPYAAIDTHYIHCSYVPEFDEGGRVIGFVAAITDISERRRAEEALREREEELREAQRVGRIGNWRWDAKTDETAGSDELLRIYGLDPAADVMPNFAAQDERLYPHESWERINEAARRPLETGVGYELDVRAFRRGAPIWVTTRGEVVRDPEGRTVGLRGTVQDITERKRAEDELLYQSQLTRNIADTAAVSIFVSDAEGRTTFINPEAERVFGYTPAELEGEKLHDKIHYRYPDGRPYPRSECPLGHVYRTGETVRDFEDEFYRKDGTPVAVVCSNAPLIERGAVTGVVLTVQDITGRKRAEEELRTANYRFHLAEEAARGFSYEWDLTADRATRSGGVARVLGYAPGELAETWEAWAAIIHPEDFRMSKAEARAFLKSFPDETFTTEYRVRHKAGHYLHLAERGIIVRDGQGDVRRVIGQTMDITEQKRGEANLAFLASLAEVLSRLSSADEIMNAAGERIAAFLNVSHCIFAEIDEARDEVVIPYAWRKEGSREVVGVYQLSDYVTEEFRRAARDGETVIVHDTQSDARTDARAYAAYNIHSFVTVPFRRGGEWRYLLTINDRVAREWRADEVELVRELTNRIFPRLERARAEEALQKSEAEFRRLADAVPQIVWVTNADGSIHYVNGQWREYSGLTLEETSTPESVWQVIHPDDRERVFGEWARAFADGTPYQVEARMREHATGEYRWFLMRSEPTRDAAGNVLKWFGTSTDITEARRLLEAERASREQAEEANRLKDEFLATVSHELRTPLTAVLGWTHILRTGQLDDANAGRALETVERNARAQQQLIEDLLDVSRVITGKLRLDIRPCDPASFIESAVEAVRLAAEAKGVRLQKTLDTGAGAISGDPDRLQQVVWNLLSNAVKFTPRGGRVHVRLEPVNSHVEIVVTDTGVGIPAEFLPHVFDRFRQADGSTTRAHGGLGLGLAIVRHLVEMHGGQVSADSHGEGRGSTFTVKLPLIPVYDREAEGERVHPKADSALSPVECSDRLDGLRVLVVDDEPDTCELLRMLLKRCGAEVVTATSAEEALARVGESRFDLLVSDIGMPGADGYELISRVRELPAGRGGQTPAVALTAYARAEDRLRALRTGYQMHVAKPVEPAELIAIMASLAKRPQRD